MTEIPEPPDQYDFIDGHWPRLLATEYRVWEQTLSRHAVTYDDQAAVDITSAGQVADEFHGMSGDALANATHMNASQLLNHGATTEFLQRQARQAASAIEHAKKKITDLVVSGTAAVDAAPEKQKQSLIQQ
jgi:glycine/D-amino acid oxidase-like deaminating enzyme